MNKKILAAVTAAVLTGVSALPGMVYATNETYNADNAETDNSKVLDEINKKIKEFYENLFKDDEKAEILSLQYLPGDYDNDGKITLSDAVAILKTSLGIEKEYVNHRTDINNDGATTLSDASDALKYALGIENYPFNKDNRKNKFIGQNIKSLNDAGFIFSGIIHMAPEGEEEVFVLSIDAGAETVVNDDGSRTTIIHTYNIVLENASEAYRVYCDNNKNIEDERNYKCLYNYKIRNITYF